MMIVSPSIVSLMTCPEFTPKCIKKLPPSKPQWLFARCRLLVEYRDGLPPIRLPGWLVPGPALGLQNGWVRRASARFASPDRAHLGREVPHAERAERAVRGKANKDRDCET